MAAYEFPTSFGQRQMWLLAQVDSDEPTYNIAWALWLDGALDVSALRRAWNAALARHEALRTTFRNESGVPVQVIEDEPPAPSLPVTSVQFGEGEFGEGEIGEGEQESAALALISDLAKAPIDLAAGPLARAALVRLSADAHVLAVVMHHIVADGWSLRILSDELSADYEAISRGADPVAAEPPIQYADFAIWQIEHAESGGYAAAERFWRAELADAQPALALPTDEPYPVNQTFAARHIDTTIDAKLADGLRQLAARLGTTRFAVLLAAYAVVLSRLTGACDLLIAVPMAARTRPETESVVGLFMNTVPIRIQIDAAATLGDLVRSVHNATARALAHQELPFAKVVELVRPDRDPARLPLVQVSFAMEEPSVIEDRGGLRWRSELMDTGTAKFEIELKVTDGPTDPQVRLNYNCDLFHPATAQLVADGFTAILRCLSDDPGRVVADAEIMSPETLALVTRVWPDGGQVADPDATAVAQLWAACDGDSVVAIGSDGALTGADVRNLAMAIAAALGGHGVGVSDRVAILLPRGPSILAAILGIWTIGASYVPLDPIYPPQRLTTMLADSGAAAIVVDTSAPDAPQPPANAT
ncbi:MAG TPA: condensation domain-containing protein, partial [Streptosporangiaceae bacterium]|nr:condensation domain-containing protein [Streptosporangiaceae bacterium]